LREIGHSKDGSPTKVKVLKPNQAGSNGCWQEIRFLEREGKEKVILAIRAAALAVP